MQKLQTVNAETLLYEPLEKPSFVVDSLIPTGLSLFCGSQKIGKSWLMLKLCLCVSQGIPLWDMPTMEGDVLYLCLEDTFCRIQDRLFRLTDEASGRLHFAVASCKLSDGLIVQLEDYLKDYPDSRLIVIDTLQKVRTASKDNSHTIELGSDPVGNIARLENALAAIADNLKQNRGKLENLNAQMEEAKLEVKRPFPQEQELAEKTSRLNVLRIALNMDGKSTGKRERDKEELDGGKPSIKGMLKRLGVESAATASTLQKGKDMEVAI